MEEHLEWFFILPKNIFQLFLSCSKDKSMDLFNKNNLLKLFSRIVLEQNLNKFFEHWICWKFLIRFNRVRLLGWMCFLFLYFVHFYKVFYFLDIGMINLNGCVSLIRILGVLATWWLITNKLVIWRKLVMMLILGAVIPWRVTLFDTISCMIWISW